MMEIAARVTISLRQKIAALDAEFKRWRDLTEENKAFEKHQTQVRALTGQLSGLRDGTVALFEQAMRDGSVLEDARNINSLVLGLRRIWEFFRSRLAQRHDEAMRPFLQAADELAWACYIPMLDRMGAGKGRQPPMVFLNGGISPYLLGRDRAFRPEDVPGEALGGPTYDPILERLPIPMIGVPWYQIANLPDIPVIAHETGHAVEQDFGLHDAVLDNISAGLGATSQRLDAWQAWSGEIFADLWGCLTLGPAYVGSLMDFLAEDKRHVEDQIATARNKYPTTYLRILLCLSALDLMDFEAEAKTLRNTWTAQYERHAMGKHADDVPKVVTALLDTPLTRAGEIKALRKIKRLRFGREQWDYARDGAAEVNGGNSRIKSATTIIVWAAMARLLYEQSPEHFVSDGRSRVLLDHVKTLISPGTRAGESLSDATQLNALFDSSRQSGSNLFQYFADWTKATKQV